MLTLKLQKNEPKRSRVFECVSVSSALRGALTDVHVNFSGDMPALELTLGVEPEYEFEIGFLTNSIGRTVQIIRSGGAR